MDTRACSGADSRAGMVFMAPAVLFAVRKKGVGVGVDLEVGSSEKNEGMVSAVRSQRLLSQGELSHS